MNGGPNRRFPRTAGAMPEARPKIEREKIRHRRPNDLLFDGADAPPERRPASDGPAYPEPAHGDNVVIDQDIYESDSYSDGPNQDWVAEDARLADESAWDDEAEDDWALAGDDEPNVDEPTDARDVDHEESGVVWEEDTLSEPLDGPDEVAFGGPQRNTFGFAPEVELAGRRDVRPKPPRLAPAPQQRAPRQQMRRQQQPRQARSHQQRNDWHE
ncbi:MAG: hypothetical protein ACR2QJ_11250, partial [Geminicoccaceae bacterium]